MSKVRKKAVSMKLEFGSIRQKKREVLIITVIN